MLQIRCKCCHISQNTFHCTYKSWKLSMDTYVIELNFRIKSNCFDHETKSCMLRESPFKCFECLYFLKIWWAKKTAALKICDSGVYIFIFVDFSEKSSVSWKPKDLNMISKFTALFHWEQFYTEPKTSFPKSLFAFCPDWQQRNKMNVFMF